MFRLEKFMGRRVLKSSLLESDDIIAFFTTRDLPLKTAERDDLTSEVENNKKLLTNELRIPLETLFIPVQTHSDNIEIIDLKKPAYPDCDALITNQPNIAIALNFADCVPIILYDPVKKVIGISHAGWKGTAKQIAPKTVEKMVNEFNSNPKDIIAAIGPAIGKCCFEAGEYVLEELGKTIEKCPAEAISNTHADLKLINKLQLLAMGVEKIDLCEYCTSCQSELFFSYRREQGKTARHSAVIMLKQ